MRLLCFFLPALLFCLSKAGDTVMGYDMANANLPAEVVKLLGNKNRLPDVLLVRKVYPSRAANRASKRKFKLQMLQKEKEDKMQRKTQLAQDDADMEDFLQDLEENPEMRKDVNLYRNEKSGKAVDEDDEDGFNEVDVNLEELIGDLDKHDTFGFVFLFFLLSSLFSCCLVVESVTLCFPFILALSNPSLPIVVLLAAWVLERPRSLRQTTTTTIMFSRSKNLFQIEE